MHNKIYNRRAKTWRARIAFLFYSWTWSIDQRTYGEGRFDLFRDDNKLSSYPCVDRYDYHANSLDMEYLRCI